MVRALRPIPLQSWREALACSFGGHRFCVGSFVTFRACLVKGYRSEKAGNREHFFENSRSIGSLLAGNLWEIWADFTAFAADITLTKQVLNSMSL